MSDDEGEETLTELKVVLLGNSGVGKSSIIKQFVTHTFDPDISSSISSKYISKEIKIEDINKTVKFNLWDTAGQEKYRSLAKIFYKDALIIIFVYSIDNKNSFEDLKTYWYHEVKNNSSANAIFGVIGNKNDLYNFSQIEESEGLEWADSIGGIFQSTSAKSNAGIDLLFNNLAKKYFDPNFDYNKDEQKAKQLYEMKKKEKNKNKTIEKNEDDIVKIPPVKQTVKLQKIENDTKGAQKKRKCC